MSDGSNNVNEERARRGKELRALVKSWTTEESFQDALAEQQLAIERGELSVNADWSEIADEILGSFMAFANRPQMPDWDESKSSES